ncbi:MAG: hypothetical protein U5L01_07740 [Rheinheimera sp.]|nr:hypothetical protein [Rheinheimera sp.]
MKSLIRDDGYVIQPHHPINIDEHLLTAAFDGVIRQQVKNGENSAKVDFIALPSWRFSQHDRPASPIGSGPSPDAVATQHDIGNDRKMRLY